MHDLECQVVCAGKQFQIFIRDGFAKFNFPLLMQKMMQSIQVVNIINIFLKKNHGSKGSNDSPLRVKWASTLAANAVVIDVLSFSCPNLISYIFKFSALISHASSLDLTPVIIISLFIHRGKTERKYLLFACFYEQGV